MGRLTALKVKALTMPGRYGDGDGLWLQVRDAAHRSWLFRYTRHGRARQMGLGPADEVPLADAREAAQTARKLLREGKDPIDLRQAAFQAQRAGAAQTTFKAVSEMCWAAHQGSWRSAKHRAQWMAALDRHVHPVIGARHVAEVDTAAVTRILEPIWRTKPETASRLRGRIEQVLDYAAARGWRTGDNPARWRGHLANLLPGRFKVAAVAHHAALPWAEIGAFLGALRGEVGVAPRALEFVVYTACRTNEALGARWAEVDLDAKVWTIPAERMKAGRAHRVPLSTAALAVLSALPFGREEDAFVFPGRSKGRSLSPNALSMAAARLNEGKEPRWKDATTGELVTVHGFRSTFRDWAAERTGFAREVAEAALAHTLRDAVEAAYRRGDLFEKRRRLMQAWADYCRQPAAGGVVRTLRGAG